MKNFNKIMTAVLIMTATLTACGNSGEISAEIPESSSNSEISAEQSTEDEDTAVEETNEVTEEETTEAETTAVATVPIEDRKEKITSFSSYDPVVEYDVTYYYLPKNATDISDDINLGLITVDGKEFDITSLANAYGEDEIASIFNEQAGLYTTDQLIENGVFDDVTVDKKGSPTGYNFIFGTNMGESDVEINEVTYGFDKSRGKYDFINAEYVNGWFIGLHSSCKSGNNGRFVEQVTVNGVEMPFLEEETANPQLLANDTNLITFTEKNVKIGIGGETTYSDLVSMFGTEPTRVDCDTLTGDIYTYRNSTVTVGFVINDFYSGDRSSKWTEEDRETAPVVAVYMWLND